MWRTFVGSAFLLIVIAVPSLVLPAAEPPEPALAKPEGPGQSPASNVVGQGQVNLTVGNSSATATFVAVPAGGPNAVSPPPLATTGAGTLVLQGVNSGATLSGAYVPNGVDNAAAAGVNNYSGATTVFVGAADTSSFNLNGAVDGPAYTLTTLGGPLGLSVNVPAPHSPPAPIPRGPVFYLITEGAGLGDGVRAVPCTGKETVLSAVGAAGGISMVSGRKIWIARPTAGNADKSTLLNVDWDAISKRGINTTNYTLQPNDRLVFGEDAHTTQSNLLTKKTSPIERIDGVVSLTTSTLRGVRNTPGAAKLIKDLVEKNLLTDDEQLKTFLLDAIRDQENMKPGAKAAENAKPDQATVNSGSLTIELPAEQRAAGKKSTEWAKVYEITISGNGATVSIGAPSSRTPAASAPHELAMKPLPAYRIEPPDVVSIDLPKVIPLPPYRIAIFDVLQIKANAPQEQPIDNYYMVDAEGKVDLGPQYGSVKVAGMTVDEIRAALDKHLRQYLTAPDSYVQVAKVAGMQPVTGQYLVGPDGTVNLRKYGRVAIFGMTLAEAKAAIEKQLAKFLQSPEVTVEVIAYNSKVYYMVTQGAGLGDSIRRLPITGNETVLSAISQINGLSQVSSSKDIRIVRPSADPQKPIILPVDWDAITRRGETATNYQIFPGDRVYIGQDLLLTGTNLISKKTAPIERAMGIIGLTTSTIRSMNVTHGGPAGVKELVRKGVFDNDPELKRIVEETIRISEEAVKKEGPQQPLNDWP